MDASFGDDDMGRRWLVITASVVLGGCNWLAGIHEHPYEPDLTGDATAPDATADSCALDSACGAPIDPADASLADTAVVLDARGAQDASDAGSSDGEVTEVGPGDACDDGCDLPPTLRAFDATDAELDATTWGFRDNATTWDGAARAANDFCIGKGFAGGIVNGYAAAGLHRVLCHRNLASWFDAHDAELEATGWSFKNNAASWDQAARAASGFCLARGYAGGAFNGFIASDRHGIFCYPSGDATKLDATDAELDATTWGFRGNGATWDRAARAANDLCVGKGYLTGYLNGFFAGDLHGTVCLK